VSKHKFNKEDFMDKIEGSIVSLMHNLNISERKQINMSGIKKIVSFDNEEFLMESSQGMLLLKGTGLEIIKLDTHDGNVAIKGHVNQLTYLDDKEKIKEDSFLTKLFK